MGKILLCYIVKYPSYITNLIYYGVDPKTVQYFAGHEKLMNILEI